jgi:hypothetical protein
MADLLTHRDGMRENVPWWLRGSVAGRILYAVGAVLDVLADMAVAAIQVRFLAPADEAALQASGRERRIQRGRAETAINYARRLILWLDAHRERGGPYGLLAQFFAFWVGPGMFLTALVYASGRRFQMALDGTVTRDDAGWTPAGSSGDWARWWLYCQWPTEIGDDGLWSSGGTWEDGGLWDIDGNDLDVNTVEDLRLVPREWNAAHCKGYIVLMSASAELWDYPSGVWDDPGTWGYGTAGELLTIDVDN